MSLVIMGANYKSAPLEVLEKISFADAELESAIAELRQAEGVDGAVVLSTCNRVEAYVDARTDRYGTDALRGLFERRLRKPVELGAFYVKRGEDVVRHLFRVVCSLDSQVLGEAQILGQARRSFERSFENGCCTEVLAQLFRDALHLGKRVRFETGIGADSVSLSTIAFKVAQREFPDLENRQVMFLGTGEMAALALPYLLEAGVCDFMVASRSIEHAREFARECDGRVMRFEDRYEGIAKADIVFCMTASPHAVVEAEPLRRARERYGATGRRLLFVDEAVPRDVAVSCRDVDGVTVYSMDALNAIVDDGMETRMAAVGAVERLVSQAERDFLAWMQQRTVVPTVKAMYEKGQAVVAGEFQKAARTLARERGGQLSADELKTLEAYGTAVMKKILHGPATRLKRESETADSYYYTGSARYLFGLDTFPPGCRPHSCEGRPCLEGKTCPNGLVGPKSADGRER